MSSTDRVRPSDLVADDHAEPRQRIGCRSLEHCARTDRCRAQRFSSRGTGPWRLVSGGYVSTTTRISTPRAISSDRFGWRVPSPMTSARATRVGGDAESLSPRPARAGSCHSTLSGRRHAPRRHRVGDLTAPSSRLISAVTCRPGATAVVDRFDRRGTGSGRLSLGRSVRDAQQRIDRQLHARHVARSDDRHTARDRWQDLHLQPRGDRRHRRPAGCVRRARVGERVRPARHQPTSPRHPRHRPIVRARRGHTSRSDGRRDQPDRHQRGGAGLAPRCAVRRDHRRLQCELRIVRGHRRVGLRRDVGTGHDLCRDEHLSRCHRRPDGNIRRRWVVVRPRSSDPDARHPECDRWMVADPRRPADPRRACHTRRLPRRSPARSRWSVRLMPVTWSGMPAAHAVDVIGQCRVPGRHSPTRSPRAYPTQGGCACTRRRRLTRSST